MAAIGEARLGLGIYDDAVRNLSEAHEIFQKEAPETSEALRVQSLLADSYTKINRMPDAIALHERTPATSSSQLGPAHRTTINTMNALAAALVANGQKERGAAMHQDSLRLAEQLKPANLSLLVACGNNLAVALEKQKKFADAAKILERVLSKIEDGTDDASPATLSVMSNLAKNYAALNRLPEAIPLFEKALQGRRKTLGETHPRTRGVEHELASALVYSGQRRLPNVRFLLATTN